MSSSPEAQIPPHRGNNNIAKSSATETNIPNGPITDRQKLKEAASPPGGGERDVDPHGSGSLLVAGTLGGSGVGEVIRGALPALVPWTIIFSLIFGGCCSNVGSSCKEKDITVVMK